jgi:hypothetical protein
MSKKSTTDEQREKRQEAELWQQFASPERQGDYDLHNPELLNALAAYAEGRADDPGRERIERLLLHSDTALDDLAFLREMETTEPVELPEEIQARARALIADAPTQPDSETKPAGWFGGFIAGHTLAARGLTAGLMFAGLVCFSLVGFQLGVGTQQQQLAIDNLILSEFPATLNYGSATTSLGGGL